MTGRKLTQEELFDEGITRFGRALDIAFTCPACGDVAKIGEFPPGALANAGQECIGRSLGALEDGYTGRGCDFAAYGLICGPWTVVMPDGREIHSFALADVTP